MVETGTETEADSSEVGASMIAFPACLTKGELAPVRDLLLQSLAGGEQPLLLDAANVLSIDATGIQLLLSFFRSATQQGREVTLVQRSEAIERALALHHAEEFIPS
jgi:anti-anti-sigma factor